ncbi:hypothetical protein J2W48_003475 [Flavobacterium piscis]|uniref:Uncharacterized protein n=1 Tax=Flavobacterium piscis TaxID=1114874 RepID=A0ABU1YBA1_9FLAO|nr:hypothetical protein [Flavobacterium piscis]
MQIYKRFFCLQIKIELNFKLFFNLLVLNKIK